MSVFRPDEFERDALLPENDQAIDYYKPTDVCFKCGKVLGDEHLVIVQGFDGSGCILGSWDEVKGRWIHPEIWLHVDCAHDLALDLIADYVDARQMEGRAELLRLQIIPDQS